MIRHVDEFRPMHNIASLADLVAALSRQAGRQAGRQETKAGPVMPSRPGVTPLQGGTETDR